MQHTPKRNREEITNACDSNETPHFTRKHTLMHTVFFRVNKPTNCKECAPKMQASPKVHAVTKPTQDQQWKP